MLKWLKGQINLFRFWLIRKLVGNMPIAANINISNYDTDTNFNHSLLLNRPHMFFKNNVYRLENRIKEKVYVGQKGNVIRHGNMFVLQHVED